MAIPIAVVCADTHLSPITYAAIPQLTGDSYFGFRQCVDLACEIGCDLVVAGDVFNKSLPDSFSLWCAFRQILRLPPGATCYFVQGQHDMAAKVPWLSLTGRTKHLHNEVVTLRGGVRVCGLDYLPPTKLLDALQTLPEADVLIAHQLWKELVESDIASDASLEDIPLHIKLLISGDYHVTKRVEHRNLVALSPGSTCLRSAKESVNKCAVILHDDLSLESVPLLSRQIFRSELRSPGDLHTAAEGMLAQLDATMTCVLPEDLRKPLWLIRDLAGIAAGTNWEEVVGDRVFVRVTDARDVVAEVRETAAVPVGFAEAIGLCGAVIEDPTLLPAATRLWQADSIAAAVAAAVGECDAIAEAESEKLASSYG